jgi:hypothetical protein
MQAFSINIDDMSTEKSMAVDLRQPFDAGVQPLVSSNSAIHPHHTFQTH